MHVLTWSYHASLHSLSCRRQTPVIKRFTGGGTVVVDNDCLMVSFVCNQVRGTGGILWPLLQSRTITSQSLSTCCSPHVLFVQADMPGNPQYPREIMKWSELFYKGVFDKLQRPPGVLLHLSTAPLSSSFCLQEQDYCLGLVKVAGNAQSVSRERWVHHTSFLWDFKDENMALLKLPEKRPAYRETRSHKEFLTKIREHVAEGRTASCFFEAVLEELSSNCPHGVQAATLEEAEGILRGTAERQTNHFVEV